MKTVLLVFGLLVVAALALFSLSIREAPELDDDKMEM
jgi:hypothetical protein